jgi:hypothetical protein
MVAPGTTPRNDVFVVRELRKLRNFPIQRHVCGYKLLNWNYPQLAQLSA